MKNIKVSVIIPTYRRSENICRAVDSVLAQTLEEIEIIVVDDNGVNTHSGIETESAMKKYINNPKVKYIQHKINKNGAVARNTGIKISNGEFISFLDDDDTYYPDRLKIMYTKMKSLDESWGACYSGYVKHQKNGINQYSGEKVEGDIYIQTLMRSFYIGTGSNLFFRRSVVEDIGLFDDSFKRNQDLEYLVRVLKKYKMAYVDDILMEAYFDIRTTKLSFEESVSREKQFREKFSTNLEEIDQGYRKKVIMMWDIDWIRFLIGRKKFYLAIITLVRKKIPLIILVKYLRYAVNRKKTNTCYGFNFDIE